MAAQDVLVLKNAAKADVQFQLHKREGETLVYANRIAGSIAAWQFLRIQRKWPADIQRGVVRVRYEFTVPNLDPTTKVVTSTNRFIGEYYEPVAAPTQSGADLHAYSQSFLATQAAMDLAVNGIIPV